ncbi:hypothetical protein BDZ91DRAFT_764383 [Kalaharituber pfeilii]|nr:hypothetical protein BDZ91DRAFT_764383 [Kalaharituber pfeilii]
MGARSEYTYKDLDRLKKYSVETPLRVIAHVDLDAFYVLHGTGRCMGQEEGSEGECMLMTSGRLDTQAQCETVRLGLDENEPLAVQQWANLIAINYPARSHGLTSRHVSATEALKICPSLHLVHVATWKAGDTVWSYRPNAAEEIASSKACLDPYRIESKKILSIFRQHCDRVEKASIDESFLDLSAMVYDRLVARYPDLLGEKRAPPYGDPSSQMPLPPSPDGDGLDWHGSTLVPLDEGADELANLDWGDVALSIGAEIVKEIRTQVREKLRYTCSAGIAGNKMLAKLASGFMKPNNQTVVRAKAVGPFMSGIKFTKIRNLGGKLGEHISSSLSTDSIPSLLTLPLSAFTSKLPPDIAHWVYSTIRGIDKSEVNPRTLIKSMLSAKSFRPVIKSHDAAIPWLRIFAADICGRLREEGCMAPGGRRPRTMTLSHRAYHGSKSKQCAIPNAGELSEEMVTALAEGLLRQVEAEGRGYPCVGLSLQVGAFEDAEGQRGRIEGFLVRGMRARAGDKSLSGGIGAGDEEEARRKRRRVEEEQGGIRRFFGTTSGEGSGSRGVTTGAAAAGGAGKPEEAEAEGLRNGVAESDEEEEGENRVHKHNVEEQVYEPDYDCEHDDLDEHDDVYDIAGEVMNLDPGPDAHSRPASPSLPTELVPPRNLPHADTLPPPPPTLQNDQESISRFFARTPPIPPSLPQPSQAAAAANPTPTPQPKAIHNPSTRRFFNRPSPSPSPPTLPHRPSSPPTTTDDTHSDDFYNCPKCIHPVPIIQRVEHEDWHFAKGLMEDEEEEARARERGRERERDRDREGERGGRGGAGRGRGGKGATGGIERGQKRLEFGGARSKGGGG